RGPAGSRVHDRLAKRGRLGERAFACVLPACLGPGDRLLVPGLTRAHHHVVAEADELAGERLPDRAGAEYAESRHLAPFCSKTGASARGSQNRDETRGGGRWPPPRSCEPTSA